jgi:predicted phosphodiesterase
VKRYNFLILLLFAFLSGKTQIDPVVYSINFIGDSGRDTIPSEAMQLLAFECFDDSASTVVLLGDNVYSDGLNPRHSKHETHVALRKLVSQLELFIGYRGSFYMTGGNHDWSNGKFSGLKAIKEQERIVNNWLKENSIVTNRNSGGFYPGNGMPGPTKIALEANVDLLFVDTQWFLHRNLFKPTGRKAGMSRGAQKRNFYKQLDSLMNAGTADGRIQIVIAHHPIFTNGKHSHTNQPMRFLINCTPFQIFGLLGLNRYYSQDIVQPKYKKYRKSMLAILKKYPNTVYVSGHEHNMQAFKKDSVNYLVSGAGSKISEIDRYRFPAFFMDDLQMGFFQLTFHASGSVMLHAYGIKDRGEYWKTNLIGPKQ